MSCILESRIGYLLKALGQGFPKIPGSLHSDKQFRSYFWKTRQNSEIFGLSAFKDLYRPYDVVLEVQHNTEVIARFMPSILNTIGAFWDEWFKSYGRAKSEKFWVSWFLLYNHKKSGQQKKTEDSRRLYILIIIYKISTNCHQKNF